MSTTREYLDYVVEQLAGAGALRTRAMFGEYCLYLDDRAVALICDDTVFVKILPESAALLPAAETGFPYPGAKEHFVLDVDDPKTAIAVLKAIWPKCSPPKPRKPKAVKPEKP